MRASNDAVRPVQTRMKLMTLCVRMALYSPRARIASITAVINPVGIYGWNVQAQSAMSIGEVSR